MYVLKKFEKQIVIGGHTLQTGFISLPRSNIVTVFFSYDTDNVFSCVWLISYRTLYLMYSKKFT